MTHDLVIDPDSGLFSEAMLRAVLPSRVATARRTLRQLGLVLVTIDDQPAPQEVADLVHATIRDSDMAARLDDGRLVLILEFTPGEGCEVVAGRLHAKVLDAHPGATVAAGIACYPAHALSADELITAAETAARTAGPGAVAIAPVPE